MPSIILAFCTIFLILFVKSIPTRCAAALFYPITGSLPEITSATCSTVAVPVFPIWRIVIEDTAQAILAASATCCRRRGEQV